MDAREGSGTVRVTAAQALIRFLSAQYVERDGAEARRRVGERLLRTGVQVLRSDLAAGADRAGGTRGDARARQPGGDRRGHIGLSAGRTDGGVRLPRGVLRAPGVARSAPASRR